MAVWFVCFQSPELQSQFHGKDIRIVTGFCSRFYKTQVRWEHPDFGA
jgi:hypothetical protein